MDFATEFFWRIDSINNSGTTTGDVWSSTTEPVFLVDGYMSYDVGGSDGDTLTTTKLNTGTPISLGTWAFDILVSSSINSGGTYKINTAGTTDFTLVGAANNTVGTIFVATGTPTGSGTVTVPRAFVSGSHVTALYSPFKNGSTIYPGNAATTAAKFGTDTQGNTATFTLTTPVNAMTIGFWMRFDSVNASNPDGMDLFQVKSAAGNWAVVGFDKNSNSIYLENGPSAPQNTLITAAVNTTYWITLKLGICGTAGQTDVLKVYAADGITLVGTVTYDCSSNSVGTYSSIQIGRNDNHHASNQPPTTSYVYYSQMGINTSTFPFPLGP